MKELYRISVSVWPARMDTERLPRYDESLKRWVKLGPKVRESSVHTNPAGVAVAHSGVIMGDRPLGKCPRSCGCEPHKCKGVR